MSGKHSTGYHSRGVILTDLLLTVLIAVLLVPVIMICFRSLQGTMDFNEEVQDTIAEAQIRHILMIATDKKLSNGTLNFTYQEKEMKLSFVNDHLILQPGTQIFFSNTDEGTLKTDGHLLYAVYSRGDWEYEKVIGILS